MLVHVTTPVNRYTLLAGAIVTEVAGTLALRGALDHTWLYAVTAVGELTSFFLLIKVLQTGMPLGVVYGIWSALGVAATAVLSYLLFDEAFTSLMVVGLVLIIGGVVTVEIGSHPDREAEPAGVPSGQEAG
jgi:small multidrug resistance pump